MRIILARLEKMEQTVTNMLKRVAVLVGISFRKFLELMDSSMSDRGGYLECR